MKKDRIRIVKVFGEAFNEFVRDQMTNYAGGLAFFQFLALGPLVGFSIFLSLEILGTVKTQSDVLPFFKHYFTPQFVDVITFLLYKDKHLKSDTLYSLSIISGIALGYSTKEYFGMIKDVIEITWNKRRDKSGLIQWVIRLREDLTVTAGALVIIMVFIVLGSFLPVGLVNAICDTSKFYVHIIDALFEFLFYYSMLHFYFVFLTPVKVHWKSAVIPAILGSLLQVVGREIMKIHMCANVQMNIAESFLVVLFWLYYSNLVFVYSAEFAKVYLSKKEHIDHKSLRFD